MLPVQRVHPSNLASVAPLFAAWTPLVRDALNSSVWILASPSLLPLHLPAHLPRLERGEEVRLFDEHCCETSELGGQRFNRYSLESVAMTVRRWREVFGECDRL